MANQSDAPSMHDAQARIKAACELREWDFAHADQESLQAIIRNAELARQALDNQGAQHLEANRMDALFTYTKEMQSEFQNTAISIWEPQTHSVNRISFWRKPTDLPQSDSYIRYWVFMEWKFVFNIQIHKNNEEVVKALLHAIIETSIRFKNLDILKALKPKSVQVALLSTSPDIILSQEIYEELLKQDVKIFWHNIIYPDWTTVHLDTCGYTYIFEKTWEVIRLKKINRLDVLEGEYELPPKGMIVNERTDNWLQNPGEINRFIQEEFGNKQLTISEAQDSSLWRHHKVGLYYSGEFLWDIDVSTWSNITRDELLRCIISMIIEWERFDIHLAPKLFKTAFPGYNSSETEEVYHELIKLWYRIYHDVIFFPNPVTRTKGTTSHWTNYIRIWWGPLRMHKDAWGDVIIISSDWRCFRLVNNWVIQLNQ